MAYVPQELTWTLTEWRVLIHSATREYYQLSFGNARYSRPTWPGIPLYLRTVLIIYTVVIVYHCQVFNYWPSLYASTKGDNIHVYMFTCERFGDTRSRRLSVLSQTRYHKHAITIIISSKHYKQGVFYTVYTMTLNSDTSLSLWNNRPTKWW